MVFQIPPKKKDVNSQWVAGLPFWLPGCLVASGWRVTGMKPKSRSTSAEPPPVDAKKPWKRWEKHRINKNQHLLWGAITNFWLVVWNIWIIFPYIGNNNTNWLIFSRGVKTTNQTWLMYCTREIGHIHPHSSYWNRLNVIWSAPLMFGTRPNIYPMVTFLAKHQRW